MYLTNDHEVPLATMETGDQQTATEYLLRKGKDEKGELTAYKQIVKKD